MPRPAAFATARSAVRTALALDLGDADGHRIMGFLNYWIATSTAPASISKP
jgi:hypothetical protein